jgi:nitrate reductase NapE component
LTIPVVLLALVLIVLVLQDAFEAMLLPRRVQRRVRFMAFYFETAWTICKRLALRLQPGRGRESLLSHFGALSMLGLFALWAGALVVAFGLLDWALQPATGPDAHSPLFDQIYMSGVTFFTLGYGDVVPHSHAARLVAVLEAGTGLGFIAVVIGYLPVLYQLFSRREAHVIQLDARAGSPPTATAMLCRHAEADGLANLDLLLRDWEIWGAELLESHLSYPMLAYYRSQHDNQSWLAAVTTVMDCCALILVGVRELSPLQARMTFSIARQVVVEMARSFRIAPSRYDGGDRLPAEEHARMEAAFAEAGLAWEGGAEARAALQALRATYEPLLDGLARHLLLVLPKWIPEPGAADHWERGHRGLLARRLVEQLAERGGAGPAAGAGGTGGGEAARMWRDLKRRLR